MPASPAVEATVRLSPKPTRLARFRNVASSTSSISVSCHIGGITQGISATSQPDYVQRVPDSSAACVCVQISTAACEISVRMRNSNAHAQHDCRTRKSRAEAIASQHTYDMRHFSMRKQTCLATPVICETPPCLQHSVRAKLDCACKFRLPHANLAARDKRQPTGTLREPFQHAKLPLLRIKVSSARR